MDQNSSPQVKFFSGEQIPVELHKVRIVQKLHLKPIDERLKAIKQGGFNTFLLNTADIFLDMLTDSGTNAMSDNQQASMLQADDAYAGSQSFYRMEAAIKEVFGKELVLPVHQGRAAENVISKTFIKPGDAIPMNYHFTTTKAHMELNGGEIFEIFTDEALKIKSKHPFKGNIDIQKLRELIARFGKEHIPFIRMEASTNLIGGQPFSIANMREVRKVADEFGIMMVLDASLIGENAWFVKQREAEFATTSIKEILRTMCGICDIVYFSSRKVSSTRGGGICTNNKDLYMKMRDLIPLFEGFLTYGGMSVREIEAMAVGLYETTDETVISQSPGFIEYAVNEMDRLGIPVITPAGALGAHVDAMSFLPHVPQSEYPAGALAAALYIVSGCRGMERGTISSVRLENGEDLLADMELLRLAFPRRVFTLSQTKFLIDRIHWLYNNRELIGGLKFTEEPKVLRFFMGRLDAVSDWPEKLVAKFKQDFGDSL
ncbi:tryptophanase [Geofilum rhodophaeum]|uniref:tryptophanase n=1 Tax=Geofilum rhodophaeum TaxID=1965019 RepID=UPI000B526F5D|nr:tryptophanase [Geofilum rhodophaeum]